jgi:hypothetical protein
VTVEVPAEPARMVTLEGEVVIVKSCTVSVTVAKCVSRPFVPAMVTV